MTILDQAKKFDGSKLRNSEMARTRSLTNILEDSDAYFWIPCLTLQLKLMVDADHIFFYEMKV